MTEKIHLTKNYERDLSLVLEDTWVHSFVKNLEKEYGYKNPYPPTYFLFVTKENLQIWEHAKAMDHFLDWLLQKNISDPHFIMEVIEKYQPLIETIKEYWAKGAITDKPALIEYLELTRKGVLLFCIWYYAGLDERTPQAIQDMVRPVREKDEFFGTNAAFINSCIAALGVREDLANLVLPSEFPNVPPNETLEERAKTGVIAIDGEEYFFSSIEDFAKNHPDYFFEGLGEALPETTELKGQTAQKGKVQGRARIVKNRLQMEGFEAGDILVSPMTTPDFMPAMRKAAAFVTDEGGITCHAAIIAREMKKPCIIGTKIATRILKDGDMVEVDADKGIVRILKDN